ncbi:Uncharacterised protein [Mycobacteroides abscessus subsp. massiliense]|nr:Uncharacterised protein [Mycobacteroides abscessus subsp. massiliense]
MSGTEGSAKALTAVTDCRDLTRSSAATQELPARDRAPQSRLDRDPALRLAAFAGGSVLVVGAVAALHNLYRSGDDAAALIGWAGMLLLALTALGGGIRLATWSARPVVAAVFGEVKARLSEALLGVAASGAIIAGAVGMWWTFRGSYASWWQHLTGESQWSLSLGVGQMLVAVIAGAALFTGGTYLTGVAKDALTEAGLLVERGRADHRGDSAPSHPALLAALIGGGVALVVMTAWLTPKLAPTISGADVLPAIAAIVAVLLWAVGSNLGWWKGLAGLWRWATDASHKTAATSGVVALLMFSAGGLGLGWFTPATVPQAHAQCPPDCGGGSNGGSYGPDASQFQPPQMPGQMPDYQGGINQPALDQNGSISIYNTQAPSVSNNGVQGSSGQQGPQQSWDQPAHGTQIPDYQTATPYTQGPGRPNPDFNPGSDAGSQGGQPNQGVQQQAPQQPQENPAQQPDQQPQQSDSQRIDDLTRQLQDQQQQSGQDRQRIDDLSKQLQQQNNQNQKQQQSPRFPSKDDKKDRDQQDRDNQSGDNDLSALLLGAASTRRRKQDDQQGPDTQALGQDASQAVQGLPGDVQTYVQSGQQIGQSSGQAAQGFGSAAQAGASLASSAQSGAVNPQDAMTVVQGVSQGIQGTADAVNAGSQIVKTAQSEADQVAQAVGDANPQLKPQMDQARQLNQQAGQITDLVGQGSQLTSQGAGAVNTVSSLGAGGMPDTSGATNAPTDMVGWGTATSGPTSTGPAASPMDFGGPIPRQPAPADPSGGQQPPQGMNLADIQRMNDQAVVERAPRVVEMKKELDASQQNFDKVRADNPDKYHFGSRIPQKYTPDVVVEAQKRLDGARAQYSDALSKLAEVPDYSDGNGSGLYISSRDGNVLVNDPARQYIYRYSDGKLVDAAFQDPGSVVVDTEFEGLIQAVLGGGIGPGALRGIKALATKWGTSKAATAAAGESAQLADNLTTAATNRAIESGQRLAQGWSGRKGYEIKIPRGTNAPATISGRYFTGHALDQMQGRGITPTVVENTISSVKPIAGNKPGSLVYNDLVNNLSVVTNMEGDIVTVGYGAYKGAG